MINLALELAIHSDSYPRINEISNSENRLQGRHFISKIPPTLSKAHPRKECKVCTIKTKHYTRNRGRKETSYYNIIVVAVIYLYVWTNVLKFTIPNKNIGCKFIFN